MKTRKRQLKRKGLIWIWMLVISMVTPLLPVQQMTAQAAGFMTWQAVGGGGFSAGTSGYTSMALDSNGTPYVVYSDGEYESKATVMKYNGSSWEPVGSPGFSAGEASYTSIAVDSSGTPYVVYQDGGNSSKATVMKYNGSSWELVGSKGFSAGRALFTSIALDSSGKPYVVYQDDRKFDNAFGKATVMKFNGNSWETVGDEGFSAGMVGNTKIAVDSDDTPYVVYRDGGNLNKATVMKYSNNSWVNVGDEGFSGNLAAFTSIALDSNGTPYVVYQDGGNSSKATVMKYNGNIWEPVGGKGFSAGPAASTSIAVDSDDTPYVVYISGGKATAMNYNGSSWVTIGNTDFSAGMTEYTSIAVDSRGTPYVVYKDGINFSKATVMKLSPANPEKAITGFAFNGMTPAVTGTVDESAKTIALTVPYGTDVTALVPTITHTGASVSPSSGSAQDFTNPVTYTVTAADGTTQNYAVTVTVKPNPAKAITDFTFGDLSPVVTGTVDETAKTVALTVPYGTDVTTLVPTITHTGASVSPSSGSEQDFTNPVTYTVTAVDGTTQNYAVTVTVKPNPAKAITGFTFGDLSPVVTGTVDETAKAVALTVPYGTNVTTLVPTITHTGASVSPSSSVAQDFTNPVTYTVTAADNSTQQYTVTVTVAAMDAPSAPVIQSAIGGDAQVTITWNPVTIAAGYNVYMSTTPGAYGNALGSVVSSVYSYTALDLTNSTTYYFMIKATNVGRESPGSNEASVTPQVPAPGAPILIPATAGDRQIRLSWSPVAGSTGYKVFKSTTSSVYGLEEVSVSDSVYNYDVTGLTNGTLYYFVVKATNPGGDSTASNEVSATQQAVPVQPTPSIPVHTPVTTEQTSVTPEQTPELTVDVFNRIIVNEADLVKTIASKAAEAKEANVTIGFADTRGHWAEEAIDIFVQLKLINGYEDGTFRPNNPITRVEFAAILNRVFQIQGGSSTSTVLKDIDDTWAKEDIENLVAAGVISGYTDGTFKPNQTITREEMVVMLSRIVNLNNLEKDTTKGHFNDLSSAYADEVIQAAAQASIVSGRGNGRFDPKSNATRAEALQIILNVLKLNPQLKTLLESLS